jgi:hypothetical protein
MPVQRLEFSEGKSEAQAVDLAAAMPMMGVKPKAGKLTKPH